MAGRTAGYGRSDYRAFLDKAAEFYNGMHDALQRGNRVQACSSAVHCVICSCDAVTIRFSGVKSTSQRHEDVAELVRKSNAPDASAKVRQILDVLRVKSMVEYGEDSPSASDTMLVVKQAERIFKWAKDVVER